MTRRSMRPSWSTETQDYFHIVQHRFGAACRLAPLLLGFEGAAAWIDTHYEEKFFLAEAELEGRVLDPSFGPRYVEPGG